MRQVAGDGVGNRACCIGREPGVGRRRAWIDTGLGAGRSADMMGGAISDDVRKFCVPGTGLALSAATEVAAARDREDGRESCV